MKIAILFIILLTTLFPSIVYSGEIFGCIKLGKRFIGKGVAVEIRPENGNNQVTTETKTDDCGTYSIYVETTGKHLLKIKYLNHTVLLEESTLEEISAYLTNESVQYDFIIEEKDGNFFAKRK